MYLLIAKKDAGGIYHCGDCTYSWNSQFFYFNNLSDVDLKNHLSRYIFKNLKYSSEDPYEFLIFLNGVLIYDSIDGSGFTWDSKEEEPQEVKNTLAALFRIAKFSASDQLTQERTKEKEKKEKQKQERENKEIEYRREQFEKLKAEFGEKD